MAGSKGVNRSINTDIGSRARLALFRNMLPAFGRG